jgi:splicing factor 3A subunit 1
LIVIKDPPAEFEYLLEVPSTNQLDIDIIKLTAQFAARNGRPFINNLMRQEQRNPIFDFLKLQHSHYPYFTKLWEQYTKILVPPKDLIDKMKQEVENSGQVYKDVLYRVEWEKVQRRERQREEEAVERERVAYAQIDWHDFVIVETVDYQPNEIGNFPPPTTPHDVGARAVAQERQEKLSAEMGGKDLGSRIIEDESRFELNEQIKAKDNDKNIDQVAMDEDSDNEDNEKQQSN